MCGEAASITFCFKPLIAHAISALKQTTRKCCIH